MKARLVLVTSIAVVGWAAPDGALAQSESAVAPSYPNSALKVTVPKAARAGAFVTVTASGSNALFGTDPVAAPSYTLDLFVHDRRIVPTCPRNYSAELDNVIQFSGENGIFQIIRARNAGQQGAFTVKQRYRAGSARRVLYCDYTRLITDDVAVAGYKKTLLARKTR